MTAQHLTWDSRPGADGSTVHLPHYVEVEAAEEAVAAPIEKPPCDCCCHDNQNRCIKCGEQPW